MQHSRNAINKALASLTVSTVKVNVCEAFPIGDRFARIVATAAAGTTTDQIVKGFRADFKNLTPIPGSFIALSSNARQTVFEGIVGVVSERVVLNEQNRESFKAVAANMFMDDDENLWSLKATATGEVLVKSVCADDFAVMGQLMAVATTDHNAFELRGIGQQNAEVRACIQGGDLISYVSPNSATTEMGIACAALINEDGTDTFTVEVVRPNGQHETIHRELIVASAEHDVPADAEDEQLMATAATIDMSTIAAYYARVFARRPAYYEEFMRRFRAHAFF